MEGACGSIEVLKAMMETGIAAAVPDAAVGTLCAYAAVMGSFINIKFNVVWLGDTVYAQDVVARSAAIEQQARRLKDVILDVVNAKDDER